MLPPSRRGSRRCLRPMVAERAARSGTSPASRHDGARLLKRPVGQRGAPLRCGLGGWRRHGRQPLRMEPRGSPAPLTPGGRKPAGKAPLPTKTSPSSAAASSRKDSRDRMRSETFQTCESAQRTGLQLRAPAQTCPDGNTCQARLATLPSSDGRRACRAARNDPARREDGARQLQGLVGQRERSRHQARQHQALRTPPLRMERRGDLARRRRRQLEARRWRHPRTCRTSLGPPPPFKSPP